MTGQLHVRVTGVVQGVGFRWFVRERARRLGLTGWVRNLGDGSVEVAAAGEPRQLALLQDELLRGPPGAIVEALEPLEPLVPLHGDPGNRLNAPFGILR